jgi:hypothetical protein
MCGTNKSWSNAEITKIWLNRVWGRQKSHRRLLAWDTFRGHCTPDVKAAAREKHNTDIVYIPGRCTGILQPADVSWNKPFKGHLQESYDEWLFSGKHTFTPKGNRRAPTLATFLRWIKAAWDKVTPEIVRHSFKKCGLSNNMDGSEDHLLFHEESDSEEEFNGFTEEEIADALEVAANMASTEPVDLDAESEEEKDSEDSDHEDPMSPGH